MKNENDDIKNELNDISPLLNTLLKKDDLDIPENYFNNLQNDILTKTIYNTSDSGNTKSRMHTSRWLTYAVSIAATCTIVYFGMQMLNKKQTPALSFEQQIASLDDEQLKIYIEQKENELSIDDVHTLISENIHDYTDDAFSDASLMINTSVPDSSGNILKPEKSDIVINDDFLQDIDEAAILNQLDASDLEELLK